MGAGLRLLALIPAPVFPPCPLSRKTANIDTIRGVAQSG